MTIMLSLSADAKIACSSLANGSIRVWNKAFVVDFPHVLAVIHAFSRHGGGRHDDGIVPSPGLGRLGRINQDGIGLSSEFNSVFDGGMHVIFWMLAMKNVWCLVSTRIYEFMTAGSGNAVIESLERGLLDQCLVSEIVLQSEFESIIIHGVIKSAKEKRWNEFWTILTRIIVSTDFDLFMAYCYLLVCFLL
jgi:hypothetical protein